MRDLTKPWRAPLGLSRLLKLDYLPVQIAPRQPVFGFDLDDLMPLDDDALHWRQLSVRAVLPLLHLQQMRRASDATVLLRAWPSASPNRSLNVLNPHG